MKKKSTSQSAFFNVRVLIAAVFCLAGIALALFAMGAFSNAFAQAKGNRRNQDAPGTQTPDVIRMVGPVRLNQTFELSLTFRQKRNRRELLRRYPAREWITYSTKYGTSGLPAVQSLVKNLSRPVPSIPPPLLTFEGLSAAQACACSPPDTDGDVGPNHYVEAVNVAFKFTIRMAIHWRGRPHTILSLLF